MSERLFLCHLQKTAGTALIRRIRAQYPDRSVYPHDSDGDPIARVISVDNLLEVWRRRGEEIQVVTGHHPLCVTELLEASFVTATVLRHPLARTVSYLMHHRELTPEDADLTLERVYDDPFRFNALIHNHMTKMLSLTPEEMTDGALTRVDFTPERLERAKERLAAVDIVGVQEDFEEFWKRLAVRFGWPVGEHARRAPRPEEKLDKALRDRILEDNRSDVELYEFAAALVGERALTAT